MQLGGGSRAHRIWDELENLGTITRNTRRDPPGKLRGPCPSPRWEGPWPHATASAVQTLFRPSRFQKLAQPGFTKLCLRSTRSGRPDIELCSPAALPRPVCATQRTADGSPASHDDEWHALYGDRNARRVT